MNERAKRKRHRHAQETGKRLVVLRRYLGKSEAEFAAICGLTVRSYRAYEQGERVLGSAWIHNILLPIAEATDVSLDWLCAGAKPIGRGERNDRRPIFLDRENVRPKLRIVS